VDLCGKISGNSILQEALRRRGITWDSASVATRIFTFFRGVGRFGVQVLLWPLSHLFYPYASRKLMQTLAKIKSEAKKIPSDKVNDPSSYDPKSVFVYALEQFERYGVSFLESETTAMSFMQIKINNYSLMKVVLVPQGMASATSLEALAFAGHEYGHACKPIITLVYAAVRDLLVIALLVVVILYFLCPMSISIIIGVAVANVLWGCVQIAFERRASVDGLASLLDSKKIDSETDIVAAVQALQIPLCTYLPIWPKWFMDFRTLPVSIATDIGNICGNNHQIAGGLLIFLNIISLPFALSVLPVNLLLMLFNLGLK
jgi:hypothetical protein